MGLRSILGRIQRRFFQILCRFYRSCTSSIGLLPTTDATVLKEEEGNLFDLLDSNSWVDAKKRIKTSEGQKELHMKNKWHHLPLHWARYRDAPLDLLEDMVEEYPESVEEVDTYGYLLFHLTRDLSERWDSQSGTFSLEKLNSGENDSVQKLIEVLSGTPEEQMEKELFRCAFADTKFPSSWKSLNDQMHGLHVEMLKTNEAKWKKRARKAKTELERIMNKHDLIRKRKWGAVSEIIDELSMTDVRDLFLAACRKGPPCELIMDFLRIYPRLPAEETPNGEVPMHLLCCYGAEKPVFEVLMNSFPQYKEKRNIEGKTPLDMAQTRAWRYNKDFQVELINEMRRNCFEGVHDPMTGLPLKDAFKRWANIPPPGVDICNAFAILLFLDLSGLKAANEKADYADGDHAIVILSTCLSELCRNCVKSADLHLRLIIECFRMGGDEFAVVGKFEGEESAPPVMNVWDMSFRKLVSDIALLEVSDTKFPCRYSTFFRVGCCGGRLSDIEPMLEKAERLQKNVKSNIEERTGVQCGDSISLAEIDAIGIRNISDLVEL